ncbi:MAG TPA: BTAD domain-containing putative transcriptional regulator, partial [Micromonospora sp.]
MSSTDQEPAGEPVYRVLGPLHVANGAQREFRVPPGRQQIVLGTLLLEANRIVSIDALIDAIWDDSPPATARTQVQICVSALRNNLVRIGCGEAIVTRVPGYRMVVADDQLDAQLFSRLVGEAETLARAGQLDQASRLLRRALGLWRGPALSGTNSRILRDRATRLDENRLGAIESQLGIELRLGRHHQLIGEIGALVREHPLRERLRGQLMLALYRAGRQAEALETYRVGRELLIEQLGLEPGEDLRQLEAAILTGDTTLQIEPSAPVRDRATVEPEIVAPFQLPADIADFAGRDNLVRQSEEALLGVAGQRATRVVVLLGKAGVGKSALAVHVAHRLRDSHFPDGQLYCDLSGTRARPETAGAVLGRFLRALGVPGESIPDAIDERAEMYRHLVDRRRMLVVLDDAANEAQLRPLLPGSSSCAVVVTSRARLTGLAGARVLEVDVLGPEPAIGMLATAIGADRVAAEPAAAHVLVRMGGGLPRAL